MQYSISNTRRHSTFDLANLPLELRLLIFEEYFKSASSRKWNGKNLSLIKALRGNPMLYHEALNIFYLKATFVLTVENANRCIIRMSPKLLRTIRSIRLELKTIAKRDTPRMPYLKTIPFTHNAKDHPIWLASNVSKIELDIRKMRQMEAIEFVKECILQFPLRTLILHLTPGFLCEPPVIFGINGQLEAKLMHSTTMDSFISGNRFSAPLPVINISTNIRCVQIPSYPNALGYRWIAMDHNLTWTDKDYVRSIPRPKVSIPAWSMLSILTRTHQWKMFAYRYTHFLGLNPRFWFAFCTDIICTCATLRPTTFQDGAKPNPEILTLHKQKMEQVYRRAQLMRPDEDFEGDAAVPALSAQ